MGRYPLSVADGRKKVGTGCGWAIAIMVFGLAHTGDVRQKLAAEETSGLARSGSFSA